MLHLTLSSHRLTWLFLLLSSALALLLFPAMASPTVNSENPLSAPTPIERPIKNPPKRHRQSLPGRNQYADRWGEITIAQPKIWQYERVSALLDGLLRDVEGVSLADLTQLNPNNQNAAAVRFIQSAFSASVQYDQAAQVNNRNIQETWQAQQNSQVQQLNQYNAYVQSLAAQRNNLANDLFAANNTINTLQPLKAAGTITSEQDKQLTEAQTRANNVQTQLTAVNNLITGAGAPPTLAAPPNLQGTSAQLPQSPSMAAFGDVLKSLPDGVQKNLTSALQSPSYPATKQLDNFITLLQERLAREISVLQDDLTRDPEQMAFMLQFDVGVYPSDKTKNHMARVEFELVNCPGCKVYSLYPGQSSYNVANYQGSSRRRSFMGNFLSLIGLGVSASYQRQEDALQGSLVQSVYISGFQDDTETDSPCAVNQRFGWYYNAAPFDQYVTPGIRSTFAIVTIPRNHFARPLVQREQPVVLSSRECNEQDEAKENSEVSNGKEGKTEPQTDPPSLKIVARTDWAKRDNPLYQKPHWYAAQRYIGKGSDSMLKKSLTVRLPGADNMPLSSKAIAGEPNKLHVLRIEYNPVYRKEEQPASTSKNSPTAMPGAAMQGGSNTSLPAAPQLNGCKKGDCIPVLLTLDVPIDPNLVVTVRGTPLHRVRDWRGRATSVLPPAQSASDLSTLSVAGAQQLKTQNPLSRSLLETDQVEPDSWFAVSSHDLLLNISRDVAGEDEFPIIQISDPAKQTLVIPNDLRQNYTEVITSGFRFLPPSHIPRYVSDNFLRSSPPADPPDLESAIGGPYPDTLFLPLFSPEPSPQKFYAVVGETGKDLLIGFQGNAITDRELPEHYFSWLEERTQVILVDPFLFLGWPLRCQPQGAELVCKLPIDSLRETYVGIAETCPQPKDCPAIQGHITPVGVAQDHQPVETGSFVPDLQVWVEQSDPLHKDAFWSPAPASIGLLPLSKDFTLGDNFKPWHFLSFDTTADNIALEECNYFGALNGSQPAVRFLTPLDLQLNGRSATQKVTADTRQETGCGYITLPTSTLQNREVVLKMTAEQEQPPQIPGEMMATTEQAASRNVNFTSAVSTTRLRPEFGRPKIETKSDQSFRIASWNVSMTVSRSLCADDLQVPSELTQAGFSYKWYDGQEIIDDRKSFADGYGCSASWWEKQAAGEIQLRVTVPRSSLGLLPDKLYLVRTTSKGVKVPVAALPNLQSLILPSKLKLEPLSDSQFALRGEHAGTIDAVVLQDGTTVRTFPATRGGSDFAFVNTVSMTSTPAPAKPPAVVQPPSPPSPPSPPPSCPGKASGNAACSNQSGVTPPASTAPASDGKGKQSPKPSQQKPTKLAPGTYAVLPLILVSDASKAKTYMPIDVKDVQDKPLAFTIPKPDTSKPAGQTPDETITIMKTKKQGTSTVSTASNNQ